MFIDWSSLLFTLRMFLLLPFLLSGRDPLPDGSLCSGSYGPDEAQQFTSNCGGDLSLILACCSQSHVTLVQPMLFGVNYSFRWTTTISPYGTLIVADQYSERVGRKSSWRTFIAPLKMSPLPSSDSNSPKPWVKLVSPATAYRWAYGLEGKP
jgi:hypothetical protein